MICADSANQAATLREQTLWQRHNPCAFHSANMTNFLFDLFWNLALLAFVLAACHMCNRFIPGASLNGSHIFTALASVALLLDAALTFLVFADSQNRYGQFSTSTAFFERGCAYLLAIAAALTCRRVARRSKVGASETLGIHTSPYSKSDLPM
ncbi:hypothetical protein RI103_16535 [Paraburkholderia sp. FT54]|uniref:hypothetical protein n=1 Tax=Paraburkholderia sp. FT54 TaxID=3074437 RepID=UPI0028775A55|nr:hypothetical protein [Paraburkholderia sp. FT54]WNC89269.1 hypothetical protein RI103_16535 [Paraburkholderia sp. FT54]